MNLSDFANMVFTCTKPTRICVFDCDEHREDCRERNCSDPLLAIESGYKLRYVLHDKFARAKVDHFYAYGQYERRASGKTRCSPPADVVEVVRCKDCWKSDEGLCGYQLKNIPGKDFCGDGERRKEQ